MGLDGFAYGQCVQMIAQSFENQIDLAPPGLAMQPSQYRLLIVCIAGFGFSMLFTVTTHDSVWSPSFDMQGSCARGVIAAIGDLMFATLLSAIYAGLCVAQGDFGLEGSTSCIAAIILEG